MSTPFRYDVKKAEEYLMANAQHQTIKQLSESLNINYVTVALKLRQLGLKPLKVRVKRQTNIDYNRICDYVRINWQYETVSEMAKFLNVNTATIYSAFKMVGLIPLKTVDIDKNNSHRTIHRKTFNNQGKPVFIRDQTIIDYIQAHLDNKTRFEIAKDLGVSHVTVDKICAIHNIKLSGAKEGDMDYWPPFEEMDEKWKEALLAIAVAAFEGNEKIEDKEKAKPIRPKAEYDIIVKSDTLREYLDEQGYHVKI